MELVVFGLLHSQLLLRVYFLTDCAGEDFGQFFLDFVRQALLVDRIQLFELRVALLDFGGYFLSFLDFALQQFLGVVEGVLSGWEGTYACLIRSLRNCMS